MTIRRPSLRTLLIAIAAVGVALVAAVGIVALRTRLAAPQHCTEGTSLGERLIENPPANGSAMPPTVDAAISDLSSRFGIEPSAITGVCVEEVTWSDSSLGCPEPGRMYVQVLTPGERITLAVDGSAYEYHSGPGGHVIHCEKPQAPITNSPWTGS
ncbi:MAG: hypothetical protein GEU73_02385 [Chloroflexi bacterium]|nr:hypothetical protein [Chloroflexota bacterium]